MNEPNDGRHSLNAPGPFFVADGECMACGAPERQAPDLMGHVDDSGHCYFRRQPATPDEIDRACVAVLVSCCGAVRYSGADPAIEARLAELNLNLAAHLQPQHTFRRPWWKFW